MTKQIETERRNEALKPHSVRELRPEQNSGHREEIKVEL